MCVSVSTFSHCFPLNCTSYLQRGVFFYAVPFQQRPNSFQTLATTLPTQQTVILGLEKRLSVVSLWINLIRETETVERNPQMPPDTSGEERWPGTVCPDVRSSYTTVLSSGGYHTTPHLLPEASVKRSFQTLTGKVLLFIFENQNTAKKAKLASALNLREANTFI